MLRQGELHCYQCGYVAGQIEEKDGQPWQLIPAASGPGVIMRAGQRPRCGRCGGSLYVDEVDVVSARAADRLSESRHRAGHGVSGREIVAA